MHKLHTALKNKIKGAEKKVSSGSKKLVNAMGTVLSRPSRLDSYVIGQASDNRREAIKRLRHKRESDMERGY